MLGEQEKARRSEPKPETTRRPMTGTGQPDVHDECTISGREMIV